MRIAVALDAASQVSRHFGRTSHYLIATVETGQIVGRDIRNASRLHGLTHIHDQQSNAQAHSHSQMTAEVRDCEAIICGGIGPRAVHDLRASGLLVYLTDHEDPEKALRQMIEGHLELASPDQACTCHK